MTCVICKHGDTKPGHATVAVERSGTVVVIKDVPAETCADCGEYYLVETTSKRVGSMIDETVRQHAEVGVLRWAA